MLHRRAMCIFMLAIFSLSSLISVAWVKADMKDDHIYSIVIVPQFTGLAVHRDWSPIVNYLNEHTPYRFQLNLSASIPEFERAFLRGEPDFAYMNPYHAVMARRAEGYLPIIRDSKRNLTGILVVRKDSAFHKIEDLKKARIAFPSPNAFAAALYMRALLREEKKIDFTPIYVGTHSNAYRHVLLGKTAASGGVYRTLYKERDGVSKQLRVLYKTPSTPSHPLTAHARVPAKVRSAVQKAFARLASDSTHAKLLSAILLPQPVNADYERDYASLEKLKLDKYIVKRTSKK